MASNHLLVATKKGQGSVQTLDSYLKPASEYLTRSLQRMVQPCPTLKVHLPVEVGALQLE